ncbi:MAG: transposase family protein [Janthinobacterium lividum]
MRDGKWLVSGLGLGLGTARYPKCGARSSRRHGWRIRHLQDLPVQGVQVTLKVKVTRWRYQNTRCFTQTFADPLPEVAAPLGRRTRRVAELARLVGHTSGGRPAERLLNRLGLPQSDDTVLRNLKRHAGGNFGKGIRVVGVDDWAWQKGCRYGTIMVDLERRKVVDVLPDRSAKAIISAQPPPNRMASHRPSCRHRRGHRVAAAGSGHRASGFANRRGCTLCQTPRHADDETESHCRCVQSKFHRLRCHA